MPASREAIIRSLTRAQLIILKCFSNFVKNN